MEPLRGEKFHPAEWGASTVQLSRLPSAVRVNAPFCVPTRTLTELMNASALGFGDVAPAGDGWWGKRAGTLLPMRVHRTKPAVASRKRSGLQECETAPGPAKLSRSILVDINVSVQGRD